MKAPIQIIRALLLFSGLILAFPSAYGAAICGPSSSTNATDTLTDSGGSGSNYSNNEFCEFLIQPTGASSVTLTFSAFNLESGFDFLTIYDGPTSGSPVLANNLSGTSLPSSVTSSGGTMLVRFTSDFSVTRSGFITSWTSTTGSICPAQSVGDNFPSVSYSQNSGSQNWTGNWTEVGESDGTSAGIARVRNDLCTNGNCLRLGVPSGNSAQTFSNRGAFRETDLSSVSSATLSFVYRRGVNQGNQTVVLSVSNNGGSSWVNLQSYFINSTNTSPVSASFDISAYTASNTQIRFLASGNNAVIGMYIDDINISYQPTCALTPLADYRFEETSWNGIAGEVVDETGSFNAQAINGPLPTGLAPAIVGNPGTCRYGSFDGVNDYIALPNSFENLQGSFTVTAWINPDNVNAGSRIFIDDENNTQGFGFSLGDPGSGILRFYSRGVSPISVDTTASIAPNTWAFVAAVHNSVTKTREIFINGVAQTVTGGGTSNTYTGTWGIDSGPASIGGETDLGETNNRFTGDMDELRVYKTALTTAQIVTIMAEQHPCSVVNIDHFAINHNITAINCLAENITISAHTNASPAHVIETGYTGTITLSTSTNHGDWSWVSGGLAANLTNSGNGAGSFVFNGTENGSVVLALSNTFAESVNINVNDGGVTESTGVAIVSEDQNLLFDAAGFRFVEDITNNPIGLQIAGKSSNTGYGVQSLVLQAINTNTVTGACEAAITGTPAPQVQIGFECSNPATCQRPLYLGSSSPSDAITGTNSGGAVTYSGVDFNFGNASNFNAGFVMNYPDTGAILLHARHTLPNGTVMQGTSGDIVWRPFGFDLKAVFAPGLPTEVVNPVATDSVGAIFTSAGTAFTVTAEAVLWDSNDDSNNDGVPDGSNDNDPLTIVDFSNNTVTLGTPAISYKTALSFGQENENLVLAAELNQPSGGNNPSISGSSINSFTNGIGSNAGVIYNEVGIIELNASIADGNYLGIGTTETLKFRSKSGYVGRFTPATLSISVISNGTFISTNNSGIVPFTYVGQPFSYDSLDRPSFRVTALNALSPATTTMNYTGLWGKLDGGSITFAGPNSDATQDGTTASIRMTLTYLQDTNGFRDPTNTTNQPTAVNGIFDATFTNDEFTYDKDSNSQISPFNPSVNLVITNVIDGDNISTGAITLNPGVDTAVHPVGSEQMRFGRLRMSNVHGSELAALLVPMRIEIFDLGAFQIHANDTTTQISASNLTLLSDDQLSTAGASTLTLVNATALAGILDVNLSPPGAGIDGYIDVTPDLGTAGANLEWLRYDWSTGTSTFNENPTGRATFGIYKGNPVQIYIQQTYQGL